MGIKNRIKTVLMNVGIIEKPKTKIEQWKERGVTLGENFDACDSSIDFCFGHLVTIGDNVTITGTTILAHDASTKKVLGYSKIGPVTIGNDVFIGYGCIVLPNVSIGNKVIVGAGTVISKDIPDNTVVVGNPYRYLCTYDEYMEKNRKDMEYLPVSNTCFMDKTEQMKIDQRHLVTKARGGFDL